MELRHLEYMLEIAKQESFTRAAEALHVTQPTISKTIAQLEQELGTPLFVRNGRKIKLTDAGQAILSQSQDIVRLAGSLKSELAELSGFKSGWIRIGLPPMVGATVFPKVVRMFLQEHPGLSIGLEEHGAIRVESEVAEGLLDAGLVLAPVREDLFDSFPILQENLCVVMERGHVLAGRPELSLQELREEAFVMYREDFALHAKIYEQCDALGFRPRVLMESSQWDLIYEMAAEGLGIALLPESICRRLDPSRVAAVPLVNPSIGWNIVMIWRRGQYLSFAAREWIRYAREHFGHSAPK
ncbi:MULTISPECIES: LysR family transcriptional regulator [Paenibacillus]|uniref:LysR family transcriptional regulator n=1 Tax=Paenibacillus TaxID=44249 RepID=UPI00061E945B|nr:MULTISPECIES: LysR family transcriptional regulator [Paenibacillus]KKC46124.1 LysR family transcriptional regulator [Paenibacillus sp. D9]